MHASTEKSRLSAKPTDITPANAKRKKNNRKRRWDAIIIHIS